MALIAESAAGVTVSPRLDRRHSARTFVRGEPYDDGVEFRVFSRHADQLFLLLFSADSRFTSPTAEIPMERHGDVWRAFVPEVGVGQASMRFARPDASIESLAIFSTPTESSTHTPRRSTPSVRTSFPNPSFLGRR